MILDDARILNTDWVVFVTIYIKYFTFIRVRSATLFKKEALVQGFSSEF